MSAPGFELGHEVLEFLSSEPNTPSDAERVELASIGELVDHGSADPSNVAACFTLTSNGRRSASSSSNVSDRGVVRSLTTLNG